MSKRKIGDVLWTALQCAKADRYTLAQAYDMNKKEKAVRDALSDIAAFEAVQVRLFGTTKSEMDHKLDAMRPVNILAILSHEIELSDNAFQFSSEDYQS